VLGARGALIGAVNRQLQASLDEYGTGLIVSELNLQNARFPDEVKDAFDEAQRANADKTTAINQAKAYAAKIVPEATRRGGATAYVRARLQDGRDRPCHRRCGAIHAAARPVQAGAGCHPKAPVAGNRAAGTLARTARWSAVTAGN
jgi:regulator of protease activity HflC (stomatin/prohibitin superfamily)